MLDPKKRQRMRRVTSDRADARGLHNHSAIAVKAHGTDAMQHLLEIVGINKSFGVTQVLKNCSLTVGPRKRRSW